jgi:hypothetical protein
VERYWEWKLRATCIYFLYLALMGSFEHSRRGAIPTKRRLRYFQRLQHSKFIAHLFTPEGNAEKISLDLMSLRDLMLMKNLRLASATTGVSCIQRCR